jgi:hypothetical protein
MIKEKMAFDSWKEFKQNEYRRCATFELSIDDLAKDMYYEEHFDKKDKDERDELNFDY